MAIFTVHVPPGFDTTEERADRTAFVRDGFNGWAFLFGPLFLLRHRAWLAALLWLAAVLAWAWLSRSLQLPDTVDVGAGAAAGGVPRARRQQPAAGGAAAARLRFRRRGGGPSAP